MSSISTDGDGILVTVRRSKTNQEGAVNDVRFVKGGVARALRTLRAAYDLAGLSFIPVVPQRAGCVTRRAGAERRTA